MCIKCQQGWRRESVMIVGPVTEVVVPKPAGAASSGRSIVQGLPKDPWNRICIWPRSWVISVPPNTQAFDSNYLLGSLKCPNTDCRLSFLSVLRSVEFPVFSTAMTCHKGFKSRLLVWINRSQQISSKHLSVRCRKEWDIVLGFVKPTFSRRCNQFLTYWKCFGVIKGSGVPIHAVTRMNTDDWCVQGKGVCRATKIPFTWEAQDGSILSGGSSWALT